MRRTLAVLLLALAIAALAAVPASASSFGPRFDLTASSRADRVSR